MKSRGYMTMGDLGAIAPSTTDLRTVLNPTQTASGAPVSMPPPVDASILAQATQEAANLSKVVSPWLWVLSLISFGTAMFVNTPRINAMWNRLHMTKFKGLKKPRV